MRILMVMDVDTINLPKCVRQTEGPGGIGYEWYCGAANRYGDIKTVPRVEPGGT